MKNRRARQKHFGVAILAVILIAFLLASACTPATTPTPTPTPTPPVVEPEPTPTPTPIPTPVLETLTYTNSEYGFSVEYPKDWDLEEGLWGAIVVFGGPLVRGGEFMVNANIVVEELPEWPKTTLEEYVRLGKMHLTKGMENYQGVEERDCRIAGLSAKELTYTCDADGIRIMQTQACFLKENTAHIITYTATLESYDEHLDCFELMLSTFQFE